MKKLREQKRSSDEAVKTKTGKIWAQWFQILDGTGAREWEHRRIAAYLHAKEKLSPWWSQMVSVAYERERGIRQKFQKCDGEFSASASRTMNVRLAKLFLAWTDEKLRSKWLPGAATEVTSTTKDKYFRAKWNGGESRLSVGFYAKGPGKSQVAVDHEKLANAKECARMKAHWFDALNRLQALLQG